MVKYRGWYSYTDGKRGVVTVVVYNIWKSFKRLNYSFYKYTTEVNVKGPITSLTYNKVQTTDKHIEGDT